MSLGSAPSSHRKRASGYMASTKVYLKSFEGHLKKGQCSQARNALINAAETAGAAFAESRGAYKRSKRRKKAPFFVKHPAIKLVSAAKKKMAKACIVKSRRGD